MLHLRVACVPNGSGTPELGEVNIAKRERENSHDRSAVAILEEDTWAFATGDLQRAFLFAINGWSNQT